MEEEVTPTPSPTPTPAAAGPVEEEKEEVIMEEALAWGADTQC